MLHFTANPFDNIFADYSTCEPEYREQNETFCEALAGQPRHSYLTYNIQTEDVIGNDGQRGIRIEGSGKDYYGLIHMWIAGERHTIPVPVLQAVFRLSLEDLIEIFNGDWFRVSAGTWAKE